MKPTGYHEFAGCHNCAFCARIKEYDSSDKLYCTYGDKEPRPPSGSVLMGEMFDLMNDKEYDKQLYNWDAWEKTRRVEPFGICGHHKKA